MGWGRGLRVLGLNPVTFCTVATLPSTHWRYFLFNYRRQRILAPKYVPHSAPVFYCYRCLFYFVFIIFIISQVEFSFPKEPFKSSSYTDLLCAAGSKPCCAWRCLLFGTVSWALGKLQTSSILKLYSPNYCFQQTNVWVYLPVNPLCQLLPSEAPKRMIGRLPYVPWHGFMLLYTLLLWGYCRIRLHFSNSWNLWTKSRVKEKSRVSCSLEVKEQTSPWAMMVQTSRSKASHTQFWENWRVGCIPCQSLCLASNLTMQQ